MCGIIGILGKDEVTDRLVEGLRRLEYRGYDSAGVSTIVDGHIERRRAEGKLDNLAKTLSAAPLTGRVGIAHTRWAPHGAPTTSNAHPHATLEVPLVHNGLIEYSKELREELQASGRSFELQPDNDVAAHLHSRETTTGATPEHTV